MKITLLSIGKTDQAYLKEGFRIYAQRLKHYVNFESKELPALRKTAGMSAELIRRKEGELLLKHFTKSDFVILLDEKGKEYSSNAFAELLTKRMNASTRELFFVIGGAWGFSEEVYRQASQKMALSQMTFSHQMVRLFFAEQLYRAFTIIKGESYHNE